MNVLDLTASGLITALRPVRNRPWKDIFVNDQRVGTLSKTDRTDPGMRWYWSAMGSYNYASTEEDAVEQIRKRAVKFVAERRAEEAEDRARAAELAALPSPLREIRVALLDAKDQLEIAKMRNVRRDEEVSHWACCVAKLETDFAAAERQMGEAA